MARPTLEQAEAGWSAVEILAQLLSGTNRVDGSSLGGLPVGLVNAGGTALDMAAYDQDARPNTGLRLAVSADMRALNGQGTVDRWRNNVEGTLLASAARTATTRSATQTNHNARGAFVFLNVTAASGTGGLQLRWLVADPVSGTLPYMNAAPTAITTVTTAVYIVYPGGAGVGAQAVNMPLPRSWAIEVQHADASSYTYSVGYALIL